MNLVVLLDDVLVRLAPHTNGLLADNKRVISLINDFEDGRWRNDSFQNLIWDNVALTALSHRERMSLVGRSHSELRAAAQNLRLTDGSNDIGEGSELAEILLYAVMNKHFSALPVVPKIFYKQNSQDFAKGADSVHIVIDTISGNFTLWLGEAKFYTSIEDARLSTVVNSVQNTLSSSKIRKETSIITNLNDLDLIDMPESTRSEIREVLNQDTSIDKIKPRLHIPILLLHQCDTTASSSALSQEYSDQIISYHTDRAIAYFNKQVECCASVHMYDQITFHIILVPVPSKAEVVRSFVSIARSYKGSENGRL